MATLTTPCRTLGESLVRIMSDSLWEARSAAGIQATVLYMSQSTRNLRNCGCVISLDNVGGFVFGDVRLADNDVDARAFKCRIFN